MSTSTPLSTTSLSPKNSGKISKTIGYYAALVAFGLVAASLGPTLPGLAEHTQTKISEISFLFTVRPLGYLLGAFLGGRLYDRFPGHPLLTGTLFLMAAMVALVPLMPLFWLLMALFCMIGIAEGIIEVGTNTLLVWVHRHNIGPYMNGLHFFFGVGAFISPIIIGRIVLLTGDITWAYWVIAFLILPAAVWLLFLDSPKIEGISEIGQPDRINYLMVGFIAGLFLLYVGAEVGFGGWIYTYAVTLKLSSPTMAAYLTSAFWGALTIGRLVAIPLSSRFDPRTLLWADFIGCLLSIGIIVLWSNSLSAVWLGTLGIGFSIASVFPMLLAFAERRMKMTGKVNSLFFVGSGLGGMSLPWFMGQVFESISPRAAMIAILLDLILGISIFAGLVAYSRSTGVMERWNTD